MIDYQRYQLIPLSKGKFAKVDPEDFERISKFTWHFRMSPGKRAGYAGTAVRHGEKFKQTSMHRMILGITSSNVICDHINGDPLDNRKCNLRITDCRGNAMNCAKRIDNSTGFKGVTYKTARKQFCAQIQHCGVKMHIGLFQSAEEASRAYNKLALKLQGEFFRREAQ